MRVGIDANCRQTRAGTVSTRAACSVLSTDGWELPIRFLDRPEDQPQTPPSEAEVRLVKNNLQRLHFRQWASLDRRYVEMSRALSARI
jgi:hypothetical protein